MTLYHVSIIFSQLVSQQRGGGGGGVGDRKEKVGEHVVRVSSSGTNDSNNGTTMATITTKRVGVGGHTRPIRYMVHIAQLKMMRTFNTVDTYKCCERTNGTNGARLGVL
jgi:hypothetical protein